MPLAVDLACDRQDVSVAAGNPVKNTRKSWMSSKLRFESGAPSLSLFMPPKTDMQRENEISMIGRRKNAVPCLLLSVFPNIKWILNYADHYRLGVWIQKVIWQVGVWSKMWSERCLALFLCPRVVLSSSWENVIFRRQQNERYDQRLAVPICSYRQADALRCWRSLGLELLKRALRVFEESNLPLRAPPSP